MDAETILQTNLGDVPLIDEEIFAQVQGIPDLFGDIVKSVQEKITKLQVLRHQEQITPDHLKEFGDTAHSLKSGMAVVGCQRLASLCYKIGLCLCACVFVCARACVFVDCCLFAVPLRFLFDGCWNAFLSFLYFCEGGALVLLSFFD